MTAKLLDGKKLAEEVEERVKARVSRLKEQGVDLCLSTILVGENPASKSYLSRKGRSCERVGIKFRNYHLSEHVEERELLDLIDELNGDPQVHGVMVQLPLPTHLDPMRIAERISPLKDVDGLNSVNMGRLLYGKDVLTPCTPKGIITLLDHYGIDVRGRHAVIVNRSIIVGKPLHLLLLKRDATVTMCHSKTVDLEGHMRKADILVTAVGRRPEFTVTADMVKEGAVVVDVGISRIGGRLCGDVDFEAVAGKASYITPMPGGVGPMTVAMLLENTVEAALYQMEKGVR